jgi:hypothetical protein
VQSSNHQPLVSSDDPALAANKRLVYDAWRTLIEARDTVAAEQYFREDYIQHNPNADTGRALVLANGCHAARSAASGCVSRLPTSWAWRTTTWCWTETRSTTQ